MRSKRLWIALLGAACGLQLLAAPVPAQDRARSEQDRAVAAYEKAREFVRQEEYRRAVEGMEAFRRDFESSDLVADALYWEAFSLYRMGSNTDLREATRRLEMLFDEYAEQARSGDGPGLAARIEKELAERGDRRAAERIGQLAAELAELGQLEEDDEEEDVRVIALDALLQMNAERALPILKSVLARRDAGSVKLREKAVFIVSQKNSDETAQILMDAARNDPSGKVREQAIFWLGQVPGEESLDLLMEVVRSEQDEELQAKAVFALSQHDDERVGGILRDIALDADRSEEVREQAIFWLGQHGGADIGFLRELYGSLQDENLKGQVLFAASQHGSRDARQWLRELALDPDEDDEIRGNAIFWLSQNGGLELSEMRELYDSLDDAELRGQVLFAVSQSGEDEVVEFLLDVARNDPDPELRKNAVFWLGQVDDDRAAEYILELLEQE